MKLFSLHHPDLSIKDGWKLLHNSVHYVLLRIICCGFCSQLNCCGGCGPCLRVQIMQQQYSKSFSCLPWNDSFWNPWIYLNIILILLVLQKDCCRNPSPRCHGHAVIRRIDSGGQCTVLMLAYVFQKLEPCCQNIYALLNLAIHLCTYLLKSLLLLL